MKSYTLRTFLTQIKTICVLNIQYPLERIMQCTGKPAEQVTTVQCMCTVHKYAVNWSQISNLIYIKCLKCLVNLPHLHPLKVTFTKPKFVSTSNLGKIVCRCFWLVFGLSNSLHWTSSSNATPKTLNLILTDERRPKTFWFRWQSC